MRDKNGIAKNYGHVKQTEPPASSANGSECVAPGHAPLLRVSHFPDAAASRVAAALKSQKTESIISQISASRGDGGMGPNASQIILLGLLGVIQVPTQLQIHPEIRRHAEEPR